MADYNVSRQSLSKNGDESESGVKIIQFEYEGFVTVHLVWITVAPSGSPAEDATLLPGFLGLCWSVGHTFRFTKHP